MIRLRILFAGGGLVGRLSEEKMNIIETQRLILRDWSENDLEDFPQLNRDPKVLEFLSRPLSKEESLEWIKSINQHIKKNGFGLWAATLKTGEFIGYIGLNIPTFEANFTPCVEIGWRLAHKFWGKGYAAEGAEAVLA